MAPSGLDHALAAPTIRYALGSSSPPLPRQSLASGLPVGAGEMSVMVESLQILASLLTKYEYTSHAEEIRKMLRAGEHDSELLLTWVSGPSVFGGAGSVMDVPLWPGPGGPGHGPGPRDHARDQSEQFRALIRIADALEELGRSTSLVDQHAKILRRLVEKGY